MTDFKLPHKFTSWESIKNFFLVSLEGPPTTLRIFNNLKWIVLKKTNQDVAKFPPGESPIYEENKIQKTKPRNGRGIHEAIKYNVHEKAKGLWHYLFESRIVGSVEHFY